jgi:hypothetical protein
MRSQFITSLWILGVVSLSAAAGAEAEPENVALKARVSASSEHDARFLARFAVDGRVPLPLSQDDQRAAWAVRGAESKHQGWLALQWDTPVEVAEIVHFGRTAMVLEECWTFLYMFVGAEPRNIEAKIGNDEDRDRDR